MAIEAVVFDMDGVVVDSEDYWREQIGDILADAVPGAEIDPARVVGINVYDQYDMLEAEGYDLAVDREGYFALYDRYAEELYTEHAALTPGFHDLLDDVAARGLPIGLVTSSFPSWVSSVFERFGLEERFDVVVTAGGEDVPGKPEPDLYELAAERLGVAPEAMLVVEDSEHGVAAATSAGAHVVGYSHGASADMDHSAADAVATSPADLRERVRAGLD
ncbi:HAD family phosphatase [Halarchaeum sp. CBA1220]|uniref:HAD family hydrolase n=1 Tax=Halarchaeum sp. CBA1220 TaxID=1853682 RepID=UPI002104A336|nr:HAD-IA family hydrolase [Halarchaeum sp. CBA1220]